MSSFLIDNLFLYSSSCNKDYVRIHFGSNLDDRNIVRYGGLVDGRICGSRFSRTRFFASTNAVTVYYRTDASVGTTGVQVKVSCIGKICISCFKLYTHGVKFTEMCCFSTQTKTNVKEELVTAVEILSDHLNVLVTKDTICPRLQPLVMVSVNYLCIYF